MEYDRTKLEFSDRPEQIWVVNQQTYGLVGASNTARGAELFAAQRFRDQKLSCSITEVTLHRPSLAPIYGGPTLLEALWSRMDDHMEALMTGQQGEDTAAGARELAWVLAIVTNAYAPSIPWVKEEAMRRWNARDPWPDDEDPPSAYVDRPADGEAEAIAFDGAGVSGYEL
jgi:hypothetical protein